MSAAIAKVEALISRALDAGASEEEQRTSAHVAVRLIRAHGLLTAAVVYVEREPAAPSGPRRRVIASRFAGRCQSCGTCHAAGDAIAWAPDCGALCIACHRQARAA